MDVLQRVQYVIQVPLVNCVLMIENRADLDGLVHPRKCAVLGSTGQGCRASTSIQISLVSIHPRSLHTLFLLRFRLFLRLCPLLGHHPAFLVELFDLRLALIADGTADMVPEGGVELGVVGLLPS